ncbi:MAG: hypothetical protein NVSMB39_5250 [Candidatus Saccharimonadales bacterium]
MASRLQVAEYLAAPLADGREDAVKAAAAWLIDAGRGRDGRYLARDAAAAMAERGHVLTQVVTARPMSPEALAQVESFVKKTTGAKTLELETSIEPALIGGLKIELPAATLDASVQAKLEKFVEGMKGVKL